MADNVTADPGAGGAVFGTDDIGGVHYPITKLAWGPLDTLNLVDDAAGKRLPIEIAESIAIAVTNAALGVTGGGAEATALRVTIATDSTGVLSIDDNGASITIDAAALPLPTGASTLAEQQTQTTAIQLLDDIVHSGDAAVAKYAVIGAVLDDTATAAVTENQAQSLRMTPARGLHVQAQANSGVDIGDVTINNAAGGSAGNVQDGGNSLTIDNAALAVTGGGVEASALRVTIATDSTGVLSVDDNGSTLSVDDGAGSLTVDGTVTAVGGAAHDAAVSGNPLLAGGEARSSEGAAVSSGDASRLQTDLVGKLITRPHAIPEQTVSGVNSATGTGDTSVIAAQGAGVRIYVTSISVANSSATNVIVEIKDATTVIWRTAAPANGGSNIAFDPPLRLTANQALNMASLTSATTVYFSANGYKGA